jgi:cyclohexanone monooxygenase
LRRDIVFETRVMAATWDERAKRWHIATDRGDEVSAKFCIMAVGCLSAPNRPKFPGIEDFEGRSITPASGRMTASTSRVSVSA